MRIITGSARGKKLAAPAGVDTRPTSELVKEAVFSMIQFETEGARALDLFAGSGQMGLEALSRGARSCVFIENAKAVCQIIGENAKSSGLDRQCRIIRADVLTWLRGVSGATDKEHYDIAFLDPPYRQLLLTKALPLVAPLMSENGVIICESARDELLPESAGDFQKYREYRYGTTAITQYRKV